MSSNPPLSCYHCGEPVPDGCDLMAVIDDVEQPMCCPGCQAVAQLIAGSGLESFYRLREGFSPRPETDRKSLERPVWVL